MVLGGQIVPIRDIPAGNMAIIESEMEKVEKESAETDAVETAITEELRETEGVLVE